MLKEQLLKDIERHLNAGNPQEHLPRLFCETLNWGSVDLPPFSIEVEQPVAQQLTVHHIAQLGGLPVFQINWHLDRPPTLTQRRAVHRALSKARLEHLLCYVSKDNQHLSFVWARKRGKQGTGKVELRTLPYKVGSPARTTIERSAELAFSLDELGMGEPTTTKVIDKLNRAFDVQAVTDEFFRNYRSVFNELQQILGEQIDDPLWAHDYALQLLNRLLFLYFIQHKRFVEGEYWLGNDPDFIRHLWESYKASNQHKDTFFDRWLSVLFFSAFNNRFQAGRSDYQHFTEETRRALSLAPFLNGGLFTENELDEKSQEYHVVIPDEFFILLFDRFNGSTPGFLERYNFTISENTPFDIEVAVDPEMIGKVYESLVNISSGIFYTPRVEIDLMCRLALVDHLTNHLGMEQRHLLYQSVFAYDPKEKEEADFAIANENLWPELDRLLREVTVCDPACGSGSFLVGMLLVLDDLQERANRQLGREETPYERRRRIIGEQLYGVDVMDWAVHVAELRLWLQLTVETEIKKAEAHLRPLLPNFSFKVRPGDSLVQEIGGVNFGLHRQRLVPAKAGMDIPSPLKGKLTQLKGKKLRFYQGDPQLSEVELKQEEVRLFQDILRHRQDILQRDIKLLTSRIESPEEQLSLIEVERKEPKQLTMAVERWKQERKEKQIELGSVQDALRALRSAKDTPFVWDIAFVEIFEGDKKGFDIVIGNPPYVRQEKIAPPGLMESDYEPWEWNRLKSDYKAKLQRSVASAWPRFFQSPPLRKQGRRLDARSDLYIYFYLHALSLLNEKGSFCFITSNSWLDVGYGKDLQEFLLKHSHVKMVIDNQVKRSFAQSDVNTVIVLLASPMDRPHSDKQMQERLARFVMFKTHFEDVLHPAIFLELEDAGDRLVHPEFRVVVKDQHSLYEEGLEELEGGPLPSQGHALADTRRYEGGKWGGKYLRAPDIFFTILEKAKRYRAFAFGDEKIIVEDITDNIED